MTAALFMGFICLALFQEPFDVTKISAVYRIEGMDRVRVRAATFLSEGDQSLHLDLYLPPEESQEPLPVVVFNNGVGAPSLPDWRIYRDWGRLAAAFGMAAVTYQARTETAAEDTALAFQYLRDHAGELGIDPARMGMWTCSGNVNVGLPYMMDPARDFIRCAVIYYGMPGELPKPRYDLPVLLVRAGLDTFSLNRNIDRFVALALRHDVDLELINYPTGHHAFDAVDDTDRSREIVRYTLQFLKTRLVETQTVEPRLTPIRFHTLLADGEAETALAAFRKEAAASKETAPSTPFHRRLVSEFGLEQTAWSFLDSGEPETAMKVFALMEETFPESPSAYQGYAEVHLAADRLDEAAAMARKALTLLEASEMRERWKQVYRGQLETLLRDLGQLPAEPVDAANAVPSNGAGIRIDGHLTEQEWGKFDEDKVAGGGHVKFRQDDKYLFIGLKTNTRSTGHLYLSKNGEVHVLHASASLGRAVYKRESRDWVRTEDYEWRVRDPEIRERFEITVDHAEEQAAYLAEQGWLGGTVLMSGEGEIEFMLAKSYLAEHGDSLALGFFHEDAEGRRVLSHFPRTALVASLAQEAALLYGTASERAFLTPKNWLSWPWDTKPTSK